MQHLVAPISIATLCVVAMTACSGARSGPEERTDWHLGHHELVDGLTPSAIERRDGAATTPVYRITLNQNSVTLDDTAYQAVLETAENTIHIDIIGHGDTADLELRRDEHGLSLVDCASGDTCRVTNTTAPQDTP